MSCAGEIGLFLGELVPKARVVRMRDACSASAPPEAIGLHPPEWASQMLSPPPPIATQPCRGLRGQCSCLPACSTRDVLPADVGAVERGRGTAPSLWGGPSVHQLGGRLVGVAPHEKPFVVGVAPLERQTLLFTVVRICAVVQA